MPAKTTSCGVIVTDGTRLLLGHATRSPRWDIPKGGVEPGESFAAAAYRELHEETGLTAPENALGSPPRRGILPLCCDGPSPYMGGTACGAFRATARACATA